MEQGERDVLGSFVDAECEIVHELQKLQKGGMGKWCDAQIDGTVKNRNRESRMMDGGATNIDREFKGL